MLTKFLIVVVIVMGLCASAALKARSAGSGLEAYGVTAASADQTLILGSAGAG